MVALLFVIRLFSVLRFAWIYIPFTSSSRSVVRYGITICRCRYPCSFCLEFLRLLFFTCSLLLMICSAFICCSFMVFVVFIPLWWVYSFFGVRFILFSDIRLHLLLIVIVYVEFSFDCSVVVYSVVPVAISSRFCSCIVAVVSLQVCC